MRLLTVTDEETGHSVRSVVTPVELAKLSGVQLAALLFPAPTASDVATINEFLDHYRDDSTMRTR